ncbi:MAG TPA: hypothetical protein VMV93_14270 [Chloroflexota bacterium]|nr:hypothetical protein [Chloroflexota bacterium]
MRPPAGLSAAPQGLLTLAQARESPCATCASSPCCTYVGIGKFELDTLQQVDYAAYLLNFDRIELGLHASGRWTIFYRAPCRFLDRESRACTIHNQPNQPRVCVNYNPFNCWYRRTEQASVSQEFLRVDAARLKFMAERMTFDANRNVVSVPEWAEMMAGFAGLPMPPLGELREVPEEARPAPSGGLPTLQLARAGDRDRCGSCAAYCCTYLVLPQEPPATLADLDHFRYLLGFAGLELGITDDAWSVVVASRCRHLAGQRCAAFGQPERPLRCTYYDEWKCSYQPRFSGDGTAGFARVQLQQFDALLDCFGLDANGNIVRGPSVQELRQSLSRGNHVR